MKKLLKNVVVAVAGFCMLLVVMEAALSQLLDQPHAYVTVTGECRWIAVIRDRQEVEVPCHDGWEEYHRITISPEAPVPDWEK